MDTPRDRPLVGAHPYVTAAHERAHPSPTADPQVVGDLDRLQLAERQLALGIAHAARIVPGADLGPVHEERAAELGRLIGALGGAPSESGPRQLPHEAAQVAGVADPRALFLALAENAEAQADLYATSRGDVDASRHASLAGIVDQLLGVTRSEAERFRAEAARHATGP